MTERFVHVRVHVGTSEYPSALPPPLGGVHPGARCCGRGALLGSNSASSVGGGKEP